MSRRASHAPPLARRFEETARRYVECGIFHWEFVHGKLWHDPLYAELVRRGLLEGHTVVDLGCGRGIVLALLDAAGAARPGAVVRWVGVERRPALARVARAALGPAAEIVEGDVRDYELPPADLVLMLDVLHYLDPGWQVRVLERAASALRGGARILVREPDAAGGPRFWLTRAAERAAALCRGGWRQRFHYRRAEDWRALLERQGLVVEAIPLSAGTPFANVLFQARSGAETLDAPEGLA